MAWVIHASVLCASLLALFTTACDPRAENSPPGKEQDVQKAVERVVDQKLAQNALLEERLRAISLQFERLSKKLETASDEIASLQQQYGGLAQANEALSKKHDALEQSMKLLVAQFAEAASAMEENTVGTAGAAGTEGSR